MTINEIIESALPIAGKYAPGNVAPLQDMQKALAQAGLKVVVLGDFKAGKSTIINTLFLKEELLPRDYAEATAVPTYVTSGSTLLQTWKRNDDGTESLVESMESFTADDIMEKVTAKTDEERAAKAEQYSRVVLQKPGILPEGITLVDTPGRNSTNARISIGTKAEAQSADAIVYVVNGQQLSELEVLYIAFLCGAAVNKIPIHVVLTDNGQKSPGELKVVEKAIRAQLQEHGIKAETSVFIFNRDNQDGAIALPSLPLGDVPVDAGADAGGQFASGSRNIRQELLRFFSTDVQRGRLARLCRDLPHALSAIAATVQLRLDAAKANDKQVDDMRNALDKQKKEYDRLVGNLLADVKEEEQKFMADLEKRIDERGREYCRDLDGRSSVESISDEVKGWENRIPLDLQEDMESLIVGLERKLQKLGDRYKKDLQPDVPRPGAPVDIPSPWIGKAPVWILTAMDYLLVISLLPLPPLVNAPLRWILGRLPIIRKFMLSEVFAWTMRKMAKDKLWEIMGNLKAKIRTDMEGNFCKLEQELEQKLSPDSVFRDLENSLREVLKSGMPQEEREELESALKRVRSWSQLVMSEQ